MWKILRSFRREDIQYVTKWHKRHRYYMGLLCWAIGLNDFMAFGNIMMNTGIMSLIPAMCVFVLFIVPVAYIELAIGQFSKCSYINVWRLSPPFRGIGLTCMYVLSICTLHSNLLNSVIMNYIIGSVDSQIPWFECKGSWVLNNCYTLEDNITFRMKCKIRANSSYCNALQWENSAEHYWSQNILSVESFYSLQTKNLKRAGYSAITAILLFLMLRKGVATVEFFTPYFSIIPHVLQFVLFTIALMLPGSGRVMDFFLSKPQILNNYTAWGDITRGVLAGTNVGLGGNILFGSESGDFRTPVHMAAIGIYFLDFAFSTLFGIFCINMLAVFSYNAHIDQTNLYQLSSGLFFRRLSLSFKNWPWPPQIWCTSYFLTLYLMNTRTKVLVIHSCLSGIYELFPEAQHYSDICAFIAIVVDFFISTPYFSRASLEHYETRMTLFNTTCTLVVILYESIIVTLVYGTRNLIDDIHFMLGFRPSAFWMVCWCLAPVTATALCVSAILEWAENIKSVFEPHEIWFVTLVVVSLAVCFFLTPLYMIVYICRRRDTKWYRLMKPAPAWGPPNLRLHKSREMFSAHSMTKEYMYRQQRKTRKFVIETD